MSLGEVCLLPHSAALGVYMYGQYERELEEVPAMPADIAVTTITTITATTGGADRASGYMDVSAGPAVCL